MINSYPSVYALGHKAIEGIFDGAILIEEKIDGSQISFGILDGELCCRSKGKQFILNAPEQMFVLAIKNIQEFAPAMIPGYVYRGEYLSKPHHGTLHYDRVPKSNIIIYDIQTGIEEYMLPKLKAAHAAHLDLECVPLLFEGRVTGMAMFNEFLECTSILGGTTIEGVIVKRYDLFTAEKKVAMGKYVSEKFKEENKTAWRKANPTQGDILQVLVDQYRNEARWNKAIMHLKERGELEQSPRDIGALIKEIPEDVKKECEDEIKERLFAHFWPHIRRGITAGMPEWYKEQLLKLAFETEK